MNKNKIIQSVKRQEEEKVAVSLKLPMSLKEQIQELAEKESISMNSLIVATLQSMIDDDCGKLMAQAEPILREYANQLEATNIQIKDHGISDADEYMAFEANKAKLKSIYEIIN